MADDLLENDETDEAVLFESDESDESDEGSDEASRGRRRWRPVRTPSGSGLYRQRPSGNYVTQVQLNAALNRAGGQIRQAAEATRTLSARVSTLADRVDKEMSSRKKAAGGIRQDMRRTQELGMLQLFLMQPKLAKTIVEVPSGTGSGTTKVLADSTDVAPLDLTFLLLLMMMGPGGMGSMGGGSDGSGGDSGMMLPLVLLLATRKS